MTREEAIENLQRLQNLLSNDPYINTQTIITTCNVAIEALKQEPKTGHWIECEDEVKCFCSECKEISDYPTKFCPNCGAKIESEEI